MRTWAVAVSDAAESARNASVQAGGGAALPGTAGGVRLRGRRREIGDSVMVWGLNMPSSFGAYFPDGDYVGYEEKLEKYFDEEMSPEERTNFKNRAISYQYYVSQKFTRMPGRVLDDGVPIGPVAEHEWPDHYELTKRYSALGSLFEMNNQLLAVETALRDIVESFEPGIHQFRPIRVTSHKGAAVSKQYHTMVIGQFLDCFDPAASDEGSWEKEDGYESYRAYMNGSRYISGLAFSRTAINNAHLWRERKVKSPEIYFSDALKAEFDKAGLRLPRHFRMKEV
jgi:hypothetical protein